MSNRVLIAAIFVASGLVLGAANGAEIPRAEPDRSRALADWLDQHLGRQVARDGVATPLVDDATFLRRVYLDLVGTIPTVSQLRDFLADDSPYKRDRVVDHLVVRAQAADQLALVWRRILVPGNGQAAAMAVQLDGWLRDQFARNVPYDELARRLVTAGGAAQNADANAEPPAPAMSTPVAYLSATGAQPATMASSVSRVFLGVRLSCAQCHDHPFADWTQEDFWGLAAFFAGAQLANRAANVPGADQQQGPLVDRRVTEIKPPEGGETYPVRFPWSNGKLVTISEESLPRRVFSEWLTAADNPHFAATAVNRVWQYLCGRGLTESVDDLDQATDEEREMLDELATLFADGGFDTRWLVQGICKSKYYQRASESSEGAGTVATRPLKVLGPEQLYNALEVALALPISRIDQGPRYNGLRDQLVDRMSEALGDNPEDFRGGVPQALMLMNGQLSADATDLTKSRTLRGVVDAPFLKLDEKIETLFMATLSRRPFEQEINEFVGLIESQPKDGRGASYSAIMWALINSPEFVLSR